jgi:hypothetical protein
MEYGKIVEAEIHVQSWSYFHKPAMDSWKFKNLNTTYKSIKYIKYSGLTIYVKYCTQKTIKSWLKKSKKSKYTLFMGWQTQRSKDINSYKIVNKLIYNLSKYQQGFLYLSLSFI